MRRIAVLSFVFFCAFTTKTDTKIDPKNGKNLPGLLSDNSVLPAANLLVDSLYNELHLAEAGLNRQAFFNAYKGYQYLISQDKIANKDLLTICDYSQPSSQKRLYVLDLKDNVIAYNTYVAHGHNSGADMATSFSNLNSSNKSSLGFLVTAETYNGHNGYSMRFDGMERGINDNVRPRDVVMHGSAYVCGDRAESGAMMGRSWGCPAIAAAESKAIIDEIKGGTCFYIYSPDAVYTHRSPILNAKFDWPSLNMIPAIADIKAPKEVEAAFAVQ